MFTPQEEVVWLLLGFSPQLIEPDLVVVTVPTLMVIHYVSQSSAQEQKVAPLELQYV